MNRKWQPMAQKGVDDFIQHSGVNDIVTELKNDISKMKDEGKPFIISDVFDKEGNQYVDLVQEGGGVWGVALVGYTYVLEQVGIRFFSLAGTSAGAINTMLLAASGKKEEPKSKKIISYLPGLELFKLVDGKPGGSPLLNLTQWVKRIVQKFVLRKDYLTRLQWVFGGFVILFLVVAVISFVCTLLGKGPGLGHFTTWLALGLLAFFMVITWILMRRINAIAKTGYGLNAGKFFRQWVTDRLEDNEVKNLRDLKQVFSSVPPGLRVHNDDMRNECTRIVKQMDLTVQKTFYREKGRTDELEKKMAESNTNTKAAAPSNPLLCIISSDITTQNKIEFPRMWDLYWKSIDQVNPADFVRASMSIPVFFETFCIKVDKHEDTPEIWKRHLNWTKPKAIPDQVKMIDGGALSNFPINVFYNPHYPVPRMPTFGIRLKSGNDPDISPAACSTNQVKTKKKEKVSFGKYVGSILNTIQSNADKDFINKNQSFLLGIGHVYMGEFSWLNFFMSNKEKEALFHKGAKAAADFIRKFDWNSYKEQRKADFEALNALREDPNNWSK